MIGHKSYVLLLLVGIGAALLPILVLNVMLAEESLVGHTIFSASDWQERTHGITNVFLQGTDSLPFKTLRLNDRVSDINTIIFGSSTAMGIEQDMFPPSLRIYNFAENGNSLSSVVGEISYVLAHFKSIKRIFVELEWARGSVYGSTEPPVTDLSRDHVEKEAGRGKLSGIAEIGDALSYPQILNLFKILGTVLRANDKIEAFRMNFLQSGGDEYRCVDGLAKDYGQNYRGLCNGFHYDGSATFRAYPRLSDARATIVAAVAPDSGIRAWLVSSRGEPSPLLTNLLAEQASNFQNLGGKVIFFMPPLLPGLEAELMRRPDLGLYLERTKDVLNEWAHSRNLIVLDAGPSEKYGCVAAEFIDEVHATPECYRKVFKAFWQTPATKDWVQNLSQERMAE